MHPFLKTMTGLPLVAALGAFTLLGQTSTTQGQAAQPAAQQQPQKQVKDQGEYDLFNGVLKATDPNAKLKLLQQWKEKYPTSDFKEDRSVFLIQTYAQLGQYTDAISSAKELLAQDPKNIRALYFICTLTPTAYTQNPPADAIQTAEQAANSLLNAEMPAGTKPEDWTKTKAAEIDPLAHRTLGWVAMQNKNYDVAEQEFTKSLQGNPKQGETAYWLGSALIATKKPEKQAQGLFEFARAAQLPPTEGGMPDEARKKIDEYLTKTYTSYHGSTEGLDQIKQAARTVALPPAGFAIKSSAEIALEKEEALKQSNPQLALWMNVKQQLLGPDGQQYFESSMKGAELPKFRGTVVEAKPASRSKELLIAIEHPQTAEVDLKLDTPLTGTPKVGSVVEFKGVPTAFTKDPFMVTFETEKSNITGLEMEAPARPAARPASKKGGARKKG